MKFTNRELFCTSKENPIYVHTNIAEFPLEIGQINCQTDNPTLSFSVSGLYIFYLPQTCFAVNTGNFYSWSVENTKYQTKCHISGILSGPALFVKLKSILKIETLSGHFYF